MASFSHWGMFNVPPRLFVIPAGFKLKAHDAADWLRPGGIIEIVPA